MINVKYDLNIYLYFRNDFDLLRILEIIRIIRFSEFY